MNDTHVLATDHCIDDLPDWQVSLELFHIMSKFSHVNCQQSEDGRQLIYTIGPSFAKMAVYEAMAGTTIKHFQLPLVASIDETEQKLIIKYTGK